MSGHGKLRQYQVYWIQLDPTVGSEIAKTRPCVVVSPDELNTSLKTVIVLPITSRIKHYPWRVSCLINGKEGSIAADQIRVVDKMRLGGLITKLTETEITSLKSVLLEMLIS